MDRQEIDYISNGTDCPFASNSPLSQIMDIDLNPLLSEEKIELALNLLNKIRNSDTLADNEKLEAYIYIHQKMDLNEWLLPVVKEFIHFGIEKMKLYLHQRNQLPKRKLVDIQSYVVLTNPFNNRANEIDFMGWPDIEREQASFHEWLAKARAIRASLEPKDYEIEDSISND
jgi:hypothetical protein